MTKSDLNLAFLFCFVVDSLFLFFVQFKSKWFTLQQFLIQTDNSIHKIPLISFMYFLSFLFWTYTILNVDSVESAESAFEYGLKLLLPIAILWIRNAIEFFFILYFRPSMMLSFKLFPSPPQISSS